MSERCQERCTEIGFGYQQCNRHVGHHGDHSSCGAYSDWKEWDNPNEVVAKPAPDDSALVRELVEAASVFAARV